MGFKGPASYFFSNILRPLGENFSLLNAFDRLSGVAGKWS